jgi:hypothetical protein
VSLTDQALKFALTNLKMSFLISSVPIKLILNLFLRFPIFCFFFPFLSSESQHLAMFLGGPPRKPDKAVAYKQLQRDLTVIGVWLLAIRITPYVLHFLTKESEELTLDL